jgi:hypothetical protein
VYLYTITNEHTSFADYKEGKCDEPEENADKVL